MADGRKLHFLIHLDGWSGRCDGNGFQRGAVIPFSFPYEDPGIIGTEGSDQTIPIQYGVQ